MFLIRDLLIISVMIFVSGTESAKILGIFHIPGRSHYLAGNTLMKILAEKGHDVTIVAPFEDKSAPKNMKQIILTGLFEEQEKSRINMFELNKIPSIVRVGIFGYFSTKMLENTIKHENFQKLLNSQEKFDIVIIEAFISEAMKYVAHHFNAHCIVYSAIDASQWVNPFVGNPDSPAYLPTLNIPYTSNEMGFLQRVKNSIFYISDYLVLNLMTLPLQNRMIHKYYPEAPHLNDIIYNSSLVFLNSDLSINDAIPKVPNMVNIGGFHVKPPKALPNHLQNILDNAKDGVVYFSLGSNLKSKDMPLEKRQIILNSLSKLKELVLWKFEDESLPGKPENVIISKWFPQNDLLAHKNVKLFVTHGGIFSSIEAVYHGVPLLALPVISEQINNAKRATINGYAKFIPFDDINEEALTASLNEMLNNSKYKNNIQKRSEIMKDKPLSPADTINYWVEYVIRHNGAAHLRVASLNLAWYQYLLLDVAIFILLVVISFVYLIKLLTKIVYRKRNSTYSIEKKNK